LVEGVGQTLELLVQLARLADGLPAHAAHPLVDAVEQLLVGVEDLERVLGDDRRGLARPILGGPFQVPPVLPGGQREHQGRHQDRDGQERAQQDERIAASLPDRPRGVRACRLAHRARSFGPGWSSRTRAGASGSHPPGWNIGIFSRRALWTMASDRRAGAGRPDSR
jgi:hypothetical protein